jgi:hypothetical protein
VTLVERVVFSTFAGIALLAVGVVMAFFPRWAFLHSDDEHQERPPTPVEMWLTRVLGAIIVVVACCALYALFSPY